MNTASYSLWYSTKGIFHILRRTSSVVRANTFVFRSVRFWVFALFCYTKRALSYELILVSLLPMKFKKRCQRVFVMLFGEKKLSYLFVVVGVDKVFPIIEPRGKCQDNSRVFYVVQKRNRQARQTETLNYWRLLLLFLTEISLVKIASISRPFLGNELSLRPEKTTGSVDLLLSTYTKSHNRTERDTPSHAFGIS